MSWVQNVVRQFGPYLLYQKKNNRVQTSVREDREWQTSCVLFTSKKYWREATFGCLTVELISKSETHLKLCFLINYWKTISFNFCFALSYIYIYYGNRIECVGNNKNINYITNLSFKYCCVIFFNLRGGISRRVGLKIRFFLECRCDSGRR